MDKTFCLKQKINEPKSHCYISKFQKLWNANNQDTMQRIGTVKFIAYFSFME